MAVWLREAVGMMNSQTLRCLRYKFRAWRSYRIADPEYPRAQRPPGGGKCNGKGRWRWSKYVFGDDSD